MIHLRIIALTYDCENVLDLLKATPSVVNLIFFPGAADKPEGNVLCDIAREDASVIIGALNLSAIMLAGIGTLYVQRLVYVRRRRDHLRHEARAVAGLPLGHSRRQPLGAGGGSRRQPLGGGSGSGSGSGRGGFGK